jgi:hypothetical protein
MKIVLKVVYLAIILGTVAACTPAPSTPLEILEAETDLPTDTIVPIKTPTNVLLPTLTPEVEHIPTETPESDQTLKVLFVGNSYTFYNNLPEMFEKLMVSGGYEIVVEQSTFGGWSLSNHALSSETTEKIANTDWDYVILQEQSVVTNPEIDMYPAIRELNTQVGDIGAESILFMTWGRRDGLESAGYPDYESMQTEIRENYQTIADELGLTIAPVGLAWQYALVENPGLQLWDADGSHSSKEGTYLAAGVFYAVLTRESPEGLDYLAGLTEEMAQILQRLVSESILGNSQGSREPENGDRNQLNIKKRVDIGRYQLFIHRFGSGTPTASYQDG